MYEVATWHVNYALKTSVGPLFFLKTKNGQAAKAAESSSQSSLTFGVTYYIQSYYFVLNIAWAFNFSIVADVFKHPFDGGKCC